MIVHTKFIKRNRSLITYVLMLGDDNSIGFIEKPDTSGLTKEIAVYYNM